MAPLRFGEKLVKDRFIDRAQLDLALRHQAKTGLRLGEALLDLGYIDEEHLLKYMAREFKTRFVSTKKLSRVSVPTEALARVPEQLCEQRLIFPVLYDPATKSLGVVTCEPQNQEFVEELRIIASVRSVQVFVALRASIRAAIRKHYRGDVQAFATLEREDPPQLEPIPDLYGESLPPSPPLAKQPAVLVAPGEEFRSESKQWGQQIEAIRQTQLGSDNTFIETLNILVGLLELSRPPFQGHSARLARLVWTFAELLEIRDLARNHLVMAAFLHDVGKRNDLHLTLLTQGDPARQRIAHRYHLTPIRLFDAIGLPEAVKQALGHMYESYDGSGIPDKLSSQSIPLGARLLALADAYEELTVNPMNPFGRTLAPDEALAELRRTQGRLFDPKMVAILEAALAGAGEPQRIENGDALASASEDTSLPGPPTGTLAGMVRTGNVLTGSLDGRPALELIRALSGKRQSGLLSLGAGGKKGFVFFEKGHVFEAQVGGTHAEEAFLDLATWRDAVYLFDPSKTAPKRAIKTPTGKLIQIAAMSL